MSGSDSFFQDVNIVIRKSTAKQGRVLQTLNHATKDKVGIFLWRWTDTALTRPDNARLYVLMNDASLRPAKTS